MAFEVEKLDISLPTAVDLSGSQYCAVSVDSSGNAILPTAAGDPIIGILQNDPKAGQTASVRVLGVSYVVSSAVVADGALVTVDTAGKATTAAAGNYIAGIAIGGAAAAGDYVSMLLKSFGTVPAA